MENQKCRTATHGLPYDMRVIVEGVHASPRQITRMELARKYGRTIIDRLIAGGHLAEGITAKGHDCIIATCMTETEINNYFTRPWTDEDDVTLQKYWGEGLSTLSIGKSMDRAGGNILGRAWELELARGQRKPDDFTITAPVWKIRSLRAVLIDAERRGIDPTDDGEGLEHKALTRRFSMGRMLTASITTPPSWPQADLALFRRLRDRQMTTKAIAHALMRNPADVASRMMMDGRNLSNLWTDKENKIIVECNARGMDLEEMAKMLPGRTLYAIRGRRRILCGNRSKYKPWTKAEDHALLDAWERGVRGLALADAVPGRSAHACRQHLRVLLQVIRTSAPWSDVEEQLLIRAAYTKKKIKEMSDWLGREELEIRRKLKELGMDKRSRANHSVPVLSGAAINVILRAPCSEAQGIGKRPTITTETLDIIHLRRVGRESLTDICKDLDISRAAVYRAMERHGMKVDVYANPGSTKKAKVEDAYKGAYAELEDIVQRKENGESITSIACRYGVSRATIQRRIKLHEDGKLDYV